MVFLIYDANNRTCLVGEQRHSVKNSGRREKFVEQAHKGGEKYEVREEVVAWRRGKVYIRTLGG